MDSKTLRSPRDLKSNENFKIWSEHKIPGVNSKLHAYVSEDQRHRGFCSSCCHLRPSSPPYQEESEFALCSTGRAAVSFTLQRLEFHEPSCLYTPGMILYTPHYCSLFTFSKPLVTINLEFKGAPLN